METAEKGLFGKLIGVNPRLYDRLNTVCSVVLVGCFAVMVALAVQGMTSAKIRPAVLEVTAPAAPFVVDAAAESAATPPAEKPHKNA